MAIASNVYTGPYTANGTQTAFAFDFTAVSASDVSVQVDGASISSNLYVVSISDAGTGTVTFSVPPASGASVLLLLTPDFSQETVYENEGAYKLSTVNATNRRAATRANYLNAVAKRSLLVPLGETAPMVASLASANGKVLGVVNGVVTPVDNTVVDASNSAAVAAASRIAAGISETNAATSETNAAASAATSGAASVAAIQAATAAQGAVHTLPTSVSVGGALPFEVTALSGSFVGTGTGGTPGEYALTVSGGPAGHTAFITVGSDGKIASARIGARGIATASTAPTYALPSGTGLTGATLPTPTVTALAAGRIFFAPSADARQKLAWQSSGGVISAYNVGGAQWSEYFKTGIDALNTSRDALLASWSTPKKNIFDKASMIRAGRRYSVAASGIVVDATGRCTTFIPVVPGQVWTVSGGQPNFTGGFFPTAIETGGTGFGFAGAGITQKTVTVPIGANFMVVNLCDNGTLNLAYDNTLQIEAGEVATTYEAYTLQVDPADIKNGIAASQVTELAGAYVASKNLFNRALARAGRRYSPASDQIVSDATSRCTGFIPVTPGKTYTISGGESGFTGGWFATESDTGTATDLGFATSTRLTAVCPAGRFFLVVNLSNGTNTSIYDATLQVEEGADATFYTPFGSVYLDPKRIAKGIDISQITNLANLTANFNAEAWLKYVGGASQPYWRDKWPAFTQKYLSKSADVTVVSVGTSLTARTIEHHSEQPTAKNRPPLMHSLNEASYIWDALARGWDGQKYSRYDDMAVVTEGVGTWATASNLAEWDDATYRDGLTRYSSTNGASVTFAVPAGAWAWRFIHRTDTVASTALQVTISAGNGVAQVFDEGSSTWVEANGYTFSQREATPVTRSVSIPNPDTDVFTSSTIASKGNTTYQKRLRLRFTNRASAKTVTITNTVNGTRFNYWGCEWSPREFMLTYVNAARGSHNTQATSSLGLPRFADNEVHSFKPDLIYSELPIHNDGASGIATFATWDRWGRLTNNYVWRADYELSLVTRAAFFGYTPEFGWWTPSIAYGFGGIGEDGQLLTSQMTDGRVMTALDKFDQAVSWVRQNKPNAVIVHAVRRWVEAGFAIYGDMKTATQASSKTGPSMTNDGSHSNDIGAKVLAKLLIGPLDFAA